MINDQTKKIDTVYFITGFPIDISIYDIQGVSLIPEHSEPVIVKTTVAYKGKLFRMMIFEIIEFCSENN